MGEARNFDQFSYEIPGLPYEVGTWIRDRFKAMDFDASMDPAMAHGFSWDFVDLAEEEVNRAYGAGEITDADRIAQLRNTPLDDRQYAWRVWGSGILRLDLLANAYQEFLKRFFPDEIIACGWAHTCTELVSDQFGGGAMVVTANEMQVIDSFEWAKGIVDRERAARGN